MADFSRWEADYPGDRADGTSAWRLQNWWNSRRSRIPSQAKREFDVFVSKLGDFEVATEKVGAFYELETATQTLIDKLHETRTMDVKVGRVHLLHYRHGGLAHKYPNLELALKNTLENLRPDGYVPSQYRDW